MIYCEGSWDDLRPLHPIPTHNLVMLRRRARQAYAAKLSSWEFHVSEYERAQAEDAKMRQFTQNNRGN